MPWARCEAAKKTYIKDVGSIFPTNAKFAALDGWPCVYTWHPPQGWALVNGRWEERWADVICKAGMISKVELDDFGELPPLPADAFS